MPCSIFVSRSPLPKVLILAMSFKTITVMLLLSCLGATSTSLGETKEPPQNARGATTIDKVGWLWDGTSTIVQFCTTEDLSTGEITMVFEDGTGTVYTFDGVVDPSTSTCANSAQPVLFQLNENVARYELLVTGSSASGGIVQGSTTFAITLRTTLLTCFDSLITKITWTESETLPFGFCLKGFSALNKACYHEGDLSGTEFCFKVTDVDGNRVDVCLNGPMDSTVDSNGIATVKYFYYGDDAVSAVPAAPADATLSLLMNVAGMTQLRAIVRFDDDPNQPGTPGIAKIHDCSSTDCLIKSYIQQNAPYDVCVEAMDDSLTSLQTATTLFTDMNLNVFEGGAQLVEMVFANGLIGKQYKAALYPNPPPDYSADTILSESILDCTSVEANHACFGFLDNNGGLSPVYVALSDSDGTTNTIIVPYNISPPPKA